MTTRRFLILLVAALVAIGGAFWLAAQRHLARATLTGDPVLAELKPALNEITKAHLSKGDGSGVTLERRADGWIVAERGFPADVGRVRKLLLDLSALEVVEEKTHDPKNYAQLGVDDPSGAASQGVLVELTAPKPLPALIIGKPAGNRAVYVRRRGAEASFLARPQLTLETTPRSWIERTILDVKSDRVHELTVTVAGAPAYTARRAKRADADFTVAPLPKGRTLASPAAPDAAGSTLASFTIDDVRTLTDTPATEHTVLRTFDGLIVELDGLKVGEHHYVRIAARFDAAARSEPPPAPAASARASGPAAPAAPAAPPSPAMPAVADVEAEAKAINARVQGFEFDLPAYKFDGIFRPLDALLARQATKESGKSTGPAAGKPFRKAGASGEDALPSSPADLPKSPPGRAHP